MQSKINVGMIGMGARGQALLKGVLLSMRGVCVAAVCDLYSDLSLIHISEPTRH